jgi:hypothetical protein
MVSEEAYPITSHLKSCTLELPKIFKVLVFSIFHFITELLLIAIGSFLNKKKEVLMVVNHILNNESIIIIKI